MTKEYLKECIDSGDEIEFEFKGKKYSITYGIEDGKEVISFCEFYKYDTDVETFEELLQVERDGYTVLEMWESLTDDDDWYIF